MQQQCFAMSGDVILMDDAAEVGPIDPKVRVGGRYSPAGSIIEQFDQATEVLKKILINCPFGFQF